MEYGLFSLRTIFILAILVFVIIKGFKKPIWVLFAFLVFGIGKEWFLNFNPFLINEFHIIKIFALITLGLFLFHVVSGKEKINMTGHNWLIFLLVLLVIVSRLNVGLSIQTQRIQELFKISLMYLMITSLVNSKEKLLQVLWIVVIAVFMVSWVALQKYRSGDLSIAIPAYYMDKNDFAVYLVIAIPLIIMLFINEGNWYKKGLLAFIFSVVLITLMRTYSRGAFLALCVVFVLILPTILKDKKNRLVALALIPFAAYLLIARTPASQWNRIASIGEYEEDPSSMDRIFFWKAGMNMMLKKPLLGIGTGNFGIALAKYVSPENEEERAFKQYLIETQARRSPHNMLILLGSESGLIALIVLLLIIFKTIRVYWRIQSVCKKEPELETMRYLEKGMIIGFTGWLVCGMFLAPLFDIIHHTLPALIAASPNIIENEKRNAFMA